MNQPRDPSDTCSQTSKDSLSRTAEQQRRWLRGELRRDEIVVAPLTAPRRGWTIKLRKELTQPKHGVRIPERLRVDERGYKSRLVTPLSSALTLDSWVHSRFQRGAVVWVVSTLLQCVSLDFGDDVVVVGVADDNAMLDIEKVDAGVLKTLSVQPVHEVLLIHTRDSPTHPELVRAEWLRRRVLMLVGRRNVRLEQVRMPYTTLASLREVSDAARKRALDRLMREASA